ncbi:MAG: MoaD/ThiS family protein [Pseudomonadota bacterium]
MKIKVKYFNMLREFVGIKEEYYKFSSSPTIQALLEEACSRNQKKLKDKLLDTEGKLKPAILIFLNSQIVNHNELNQNLSDNDEVYLFPVIGGG